MDTKFDLSAGAASFATLPEVCYTLRACNPPGRRIVVVRLGEPGFELTQFDNDEMPLEDVRAIVDRLNARLGISPTQKEAMLAGAVYGWHVFGSRAECCALH